MALKRHYGRNVRVRGRKVKTELYRRWIYLLSRTRGRSTKRPDLYEGLEVSFKGYDEFRTWALANGYRKGLSPDRKDETKGYTPDNIKWVTVQENRNRAIRPHQYRPREEEPAPYRPGEFGREPGEDVPF